MFLIVSRHCSMDWLDKELTPGSHLDRYSQCLWTIALSNTVVFNVSIVVLACPDIAPIRFHHVGHHIINQSVLVPNLFWLVQLLVCFVIQFREGVFEPTVVPLENCVLRSEVQGQLLVQSIFQASLCKLSYFLISIRKCHGDASLVFEVKHIPFGSLATFALKDEWKFSIFWLNLYCFILIAIAVSSNYYWFLPSWDQARNVLQIKWLGEWCACNCIHYDIGWTLCLGC